jgi:S-adenosylmethionine hydrolase
VTLDNTQFHRSTVSRTFHGRDIFAPVAAHLAQGVPLEALGTVLDSLTTFPLSQPDMTPDGITCHVRSIDIYGNILTDLPEGVYNTWGGGPIQIFADDYVIPGPMASYSEVPLGEPLALFSSSGHLEIAVRNDNAATRLGLHVGDTITIASVGRARDFNDTGLC